MLNLEFPPVGGGAANANYYLLRELKENQEVSVDFITTSSNNIYETEDFSENIRIYKLNVRKKGFSFWSMPEVILWTWKTFWFTKKLLRNNQYDLLHCWFGWPSGIIGYLFKNKLPYIIALRGSDVPGYNIRLKYLDKYVFNNLSKLIWKNAQAITTNSRTLRGLAQKTWDGKKIDLIYNGVDLKKFAPKISQKNTITILYVGRLITRKGLIYLLQAFKEISRTQSNCYLNIAGDGPERNKLVNFCKDEKIDTFVNFLGDVSGEHIAQSYQDADIFVLPSLKESMANAAMEAMASGLPVVTTDTGVAELVRGNGIIVEVCDCKSIKNALLKYIKDPDLMKKHGMKSREIAEKISWHNNMFRYVQLYNKIIN